MVDPRDFLLNTDYELDKVVVYKEGQMVDDVTIPHGLSYAPLVFGIWSFDSDFSSTNTMSENVGFTATGIECLADSTNISLIGAGNPDRNTMYYRIYAFEPPDVQKDSGATSPHAKEFMMNTDYNYAKLKATGAFENSGQEYTHGLGYIPQVMAWRKNGPPDNDIEQFNIGSEVSGVSLKVTANKLIYTNTSSSSNIEKIYWRLYYDEA